MPDTDTALPSQDMQIKDQHTMHGHFHLLSTLLQNAEMVRCYMNQDSAMRAAFLGAFAERVEVQRFQFIEPITRPKILRTLLATIS